MTRWGTEILREELRKRRAAGDTSPQEVWIRFPRQLGDVVFTIPFFGTLQRRWNAVAEAEGMRLRWIAVGHRIGAALFAEADPAFVAETVVEEGGEKPDPWALLRRWRSRRPVAVLNLSQSVRLSLAAWMARVPIRAGDVDNHLRFLYTFTFTYRDLDAHISHRFMGLLHALTGDPSVTWLPMTPERFGGHQGLPKLRAAGWDGRPFVTLAFGTRGPSKRWFPEREKWPELARLLLAQGYTPVWLGGPDERALGAELAALAPGSLDLTGQTSLPEACAIQHAAYGNIAIDTGLAHTAAGSGSPTVCVNGHSPEPHVHPVGPRVIMIRGPLVDAADGQSEGAENPWSSAHRLSPLRVLNLLHALTAEAEGRSLR